MKTVPVKEKIVIMTVCMVGLNIFSFECGDEGGRDAPHEINICHFRGNRMLKVFSVIIQCPSAISPKAPLKVEH